MMRMKWTGIEPTPDTIKEQRTAGFPWPQNFKRACTWNNKMARLLAKEPKPWRDFSFMPKGEVS